MSRLISLIVLLPLLAAGSAPASRVLVAVSPVVVASASAQESNDPPILRYRCSGVALDNRLVATAAHCLEEGVQHMAVASGGTNLCTGEWDYVSALEVAYIDSEADLALLRTEEDLRLDPDRGFVVRNEAAAIGWQRTGRTGPLACELQVADLLPSDCEPSTPSGKVCFRAANSTTGVCHGLSGAPIADYSQVLAVVSGSDGCGIGAFIEAATLLAPRVANRSTTDVID